MTITQAKWNEQLVQAVVPKTAKINKERFQICKERNSEMLIRIKIISSKENKEVPFRELTYVEPSTN